MIITTQSIWLAPTAQCLEHSMVLVRKTIFAFGEGEDEETYLRYLRPHFSSRERGIRIDNAGGKGPNHILDKAIRVRGGDAFDHSFILADADVEWSPNLIRRAKARHFEVILMRPCIEGMLIAILEPRLDPQGWESSRCKRHLRGEHIGSDRRLEVRDLERLVPPHILNAAEATVPELLRVHQILRGEF